MANAAIEVSDLTVVFRPRFSRRAPLTAVHHLSFTVASATIVALTGPNGAGKSTTLDVLATHLCPTEGDARVCGHSVRTAAGAIRGLVAHCPSGAASFWPRLTGRENLETFDAFAGGGSHDRLDRLSVAVERVGLSAEVIGREVRTYSDGLAQRLNLARALMRAAPVWLLDEPTRSLDAAARDALWTVVRDAARQDGVSVLVATHDPAALGGMADNVVRL